MNSSRTDGDFCHQGRDTEIVGTYWHDHSLESSWGALSEGTIYVFCFNNFQEENAFSDFFLKKPLSLTP
jgi:hypothetical protein